MTSQRELDRILGAFLAVGTDELADRVIDAALGDIDHTSQRRAICVPRRLQTLPMSMRLATAAVVGVLAVGGTVFLFQRGQPGISGPDPTPFASVGPSQEAPRPTSSPALKPTPTLQAALTGAMGEGRQIHTVTLLDDRSVLVAGGYAFGDGSLASAALYDPSKDAFTPTGSLADARGYHTATLLADGRVLITGGGRAGWLTDAPHLSSAELFDPRTGTFSPTGSMATPREVHTATLLANGRVLIIGGMETQIRSTASAELYDPKTGTFSPTGSLTAARAFHTATLLADGRVLVVGGSVAAWTSNAPLDSAEIYDPSTGRFSAAGPMTAARTYHTATLLADGRVLIAGGSDGYREEIASAEIFDPRTGSFSATGPMTDGREYQTATLLADGRVLIAGGGGDYTNRIFRATAEIYDPTAGTFTGTGSLAEARTYHGAIRLADGRVLVTGGYGAQAPLASAEIYDPSTGTFSPAGSGG
jgi:hypothetical protein